ncbi:hypothetical protein D2V05_07335 [Flagellimonas pelagia]|uniref:TIGR04086 family membrane protein n=2 Tax=Flagellimonas pelagia TaxID=2306998 RepID=A0A3A1NIM0_9FLAO|nr:hypothetical protein D2V05_07335 [Allomuricauda maritima]
MLKNHMVNTTRELKKLILNKKIKLMIIRKIIGVLIGYTIFVVTSLAFFNLTAQNPHADPTIGFAVLTALYGAVASFLSGLVAQWIAKGANLKTNYILAGIIAGFAAFSVFKSEGNHYTQLLAIFVFAPVSILGGAYLLKRRKSM